MNIYMFWLQIFYMQTIFGFLAKDITMSIGLNVETSHIKYKFICSSLSLLYNRC